MLGSSNISHFLLSVVSKHINFIQSIIFHSFGKVNIAFACSSIPQVSFDMYQNFGEIIIFKNKNFNQFS